MSGEAGRLAMGTEAAERRLRAKMRVDLPVAETQLDATSVALASRPWSMRAPALDASAVASFTGFRRV